PGHIYLRERALSFLTMLAVALGKDDRGTTRMRMSLTLRQAGATPCLAWHVEAMLARADAGRSEAAVFDTGLLDPPQLWYLDDMIAAGGLVEGLRQCAAWVERHVLVTVARQAAVLRWSLLLTAVSGVLTVGLWHYSAIDDLRRALALFHASQ